MPQFSASKARIAGGALLLTLLGGCDAIYDDTKGWAGRLEASILKTAHEMGEPEIDPAAASGSTDTAAAGTSGKTVPPPAVPLEPVETAVLAAPEAPATPTTAPAMTNKAPEGALAAASEALLADEAGEPAKPTEQAAALPPAPKPKPAVPVMAEKAPEAAPEAAGEATQDPAVQMVLHLSSLRSEEAAKREWSDLQRSFPAPLGGMEAEIHRTDLGDKGTFYRVLAGPLPTPDAAKQVCDALKAKDPKRYCRVMPSKPKA
ncbi:MAG: SPOR domain-containing protein [Kiloniellaceae bacterium]